MATSTLTSSPTLTALYINADVSPTKFPTDLKLKRQETEERMLQGTEDRSAAAINVSASFRLPPEEDDCQYMDSPRLISAAPRSPTTVEAFEDDDDESEFEFVVRSIGIGASADEMFSDGQIRPVYPVFDRDLLIAESGGGDEEADLRRPLLQLLLEEREFTTVPHSSLSSSSSSSANDLKGIPPETYCIWKPNSSAQSPCRVRKSSSTGSSLRWRIRDLVIGRSQSDGKEKFVFLSAEDEKPRKKADPPQSPLRSEEVVATDVEKKKGKGKKASEMDMSTAHRMYYGRKGHGAAADGGVSGRKSFLPYRPDIVGFFANVNGLSRAHQPF